MLIDNGVCVNPFHPERGVIQGDPLSPLLFTMLVDCEVRNIDELFPEDNSDVLEINQHNGNL